MNNSKAYNRLIKQLNASGIARRDGYYPNTMEEIYDWERDEVEDVILDHFNNKNDVDLAIFLPKMKKYDGIKILEESPFLLRIPSEESVEISTVLYAATGNEKYLDIIKKNIDASPNNIWYVAMLSYCKPCEKLYKMFKDIYINNKNKINRNSAVMGMLHYKGIVRDIRSIEESNATIKLCEKFKTERKRERKKILDKFENGQF